MKKRTILSLILIIGIFIFCGSLSGMIINFSKTLSASDVSSMIDVKDFTLTGNVHGLIDVDKGTNLANYTNGVSTWESLQLKINYDLIGTGGYTFKDGDTFSINISLSGMRYNSTDYVDILDGMGNKIGKCRIYGSKLEGILNSNAAGKNSITDITFESGSDFLNRNSFSGKDLVNTFSVGTKSHTVKYLRTVLSVSYNDSKNGDSPTNNRLRWSISLNNAYRNELWVSKGASSNVTSISSIYFEDVLTDTISIDYFQITALLYIPVAIDSQGVSEMYSYYVNGIESYFTKLTQNSGETYAQFKARVLASDLQYGFYTDSNGITTVLVNYGNPNTYNLKWSTLNPNFAQDAATGCINRGFYEESDRVALEDWYTKAYGDTNAVGGRVVGILVRIQSIYNAVVVDTPKTNTVSTYINGIEKKYTGTGTLQGSTSNAKTNASEVALYKGDKTTGTALAGAKFKLQRKNDITGVWEDYTATGQPLEKTTDESGKVLFTSLGTGTYQFVETTASTGYDKTTVQYSKDSFIVSASDAEGTIITATNEKHKYNIVYHITSTDNPTDGIIPPSEVVEYGTNYTTQNLTSSEHYAFDGWYTDSACTKKYTNGTVITKNTDLYGKWTKEKVSVTYNFLNKAPEGVALPDSVVLNYETSYTSTKVSDSTNKYAFDGWYLDRECTKKYEDGSKITENTNLYGKWSLITDNNNPHTGNNYLILYGILMFISLIISAYSVIALKKEKII